MDELKSAVDDFVSKRLDFDSLVTLVQKRLQEQPELYDDLYAHLKVIRDSNTLPIPEFAQLEIELLKFKRLAGVQKTAENRAEWRDEKCWEAGWEKEAAAVFEKNSTIKGSYLLNTPFAPGITGQTWEAFDLAQNESPAAERHIAIKSLHEGFKQYPSIVRNFVKDFERYRQLEHRNIAQVYDVGRHGSSIFVSMELIPGTSLNKLIEQAPAGLPLREVWSIAEGIVAALTYAYAQGFGHLDITPDNIFYDPVLKSVKVLDFGLIRMIRQIAAEEEKKQGHSEYGELWNKIRLNANAYAGCDFFDTPTPADGVYSVACIVYELLSGTHPFGRKSCAEAGEKNYIPTALKSLKPGQWNILLKGLAFERSKRPSTPSQFITKLFPPRKKNNHLLGNAAVAGLVLVAGSAYYFGVWRYNELRDGILHSDKESIARIEAMDVSGQIKLFRSGSPEVKKALSDFYLKELGISAFTKLQSFSPEVKSLILKEELVEEHLTAYAESRLNENLAANDYKQAFDTLDTLEKLYPKALPFAARRQQVAKHKQERLSSLTEKYRQCLYSNETPLHDRTPCVLETRGLIAALEPGHALLSDPKLNEAYLQETAGLLDNKAFDAARALLLDWQDLEPANVPNRDSLTRTLEYMESIENSLAANAFVAADKTLAEAEAVYSGSPRFSAYREQLEQGKQVYIAELSGKYQAYKAQGKLFPDPAGEDLFDLRTQIIELDPEQALLHDSELHERYFKEVVDTAAREGDTLPRMKALIEAWKLLFDSPRYFSAANQEQFDRATNRVALHYLIKSKKMIEAKERDQAVNYLQFALTLKPVDSVRRKLIALLENIQVQAPPASIMASPGGTTHPPATPSKRMASTSKAEPLKSGETVPDARVNAVKP